MSDRLLPFDLERYLRKLEPTARYPIGGSGVPRADIAPYVADAAELWRMRQDDATAAAADAVARAYGVPPGEVLFAAGASEADLIAVLALAGPGARVVVERPAYHALLAPAVALGCRVQRAERGPGFVEAVGRALRDGARLALLSNPHNPTGARLGEGELRALGEAAERADAFVLVDEVFAEATPAGDRPAHAVHPRILSANSLTKCLGFGPLRLGWLLAPPEAVETLDRAKALASVQVPLLSLALAPRILARRAEFLRATREARARNAALVARATGVSLPEHGTTCVLHVSGDDRAFARRLLDEASTLVAPGSMIELPGWIRVGLVGQTTILEEGIARMVSLRNRELANGLSSERL